MNNPFHYIPILKLKAGEVRALKELPTEQRSSITPLFEIPPIPWDYANEAPAKDISKHIEKVADVIDSCCSSRVFLDFSYVADQLISQSPDNFESQFTKIIDKDIYPVPVIYLSMEKDYTEKILTVAKMCNNGLCIRIENEDFEDDSFVEQLEKLITDSSFNASNIDVILDMKQIPSKGIGPISVGIKSIVRFFPHLREWRTITLAATSFPESLAGLSSQAGTTIERPECGIWQQLATGNSLSRTLNYGDYGIASPEPFQMDPRMMRLGAKIKYTLDEQWLIIKGTGIKRGGSAQFHSLAKWLMESKYYYGEDFSWGDKFIANCAKKDTGPGSQTSWVSVGMNHHFAVTLDKLSKMS